MKFIAHKRLKKTEGNESTSEIDLTVTLTRQVTVTVE